MKTMMLASLILVLISIGLTPIACGVEYSANVIEDEISVESYGKSVYAKTNTRSAWKALDEPDNRGAILFRNAKVAIELEEMIPACKDVSVWVRNIGFRTVNLDVAVSPDGTSWTTIGSDTCNTRRWTGYDFNGDFGDVRYIKVTKSGVWWKPGLMGLDAVYAKN